MKLTKLILHFNTPALTHELCKMVPDAVVIDNGSKVDMSTYGLANPVIRFETNLGFTANWNRAIKFIMDRDEGTTDAFWLMNSDIHIAEQSVNRITDLMTKYKYDMITPSYNCWMKDCKCKGSPGVREVQCIELTAPVISRTVFEKIGFFEPLFSLGYGVEFDWAIRMQKAGLKLYCDDASVFYHMGQKTIKSIGTMQEYETPAVAELNRGMEKLYGTNWKHILKTKLNVSVTFKPKNRIAVYTTIFGGYDNLRPMPRQKLNADFFCLTDSPLDNNCPSHLHYESWQVIQCNQPRKDLSPMLRAKWYKVFPWEFEALDGYDAIIYLDANMQVTSPDFISFCLAHLKTDIAMFAHPDRKCIYDEAEVSMTMPKYKNEAIADQVNYYANMHPAKSGLYACGVIARKRTERIQNLMGCWWHEIMKFSFQDQISFPVVAKVLGVTPDILPGNIFTNEYFKISPHFSQPEPLPVPPPFDYSLDVTRNDVMNFIIKELNYSKYLEIGLRAGYTFDDINCRIKHSIDPVSSPGHEPTFKMTSDVFFEQFKAAQYDIIFIDGDHNHDQVRRDFFNAWEKIPLNGCIILHDTNPPNKRFTEMDRCGTAFRVIVDMLANDDMPIELYTINMPKDEGNGISIVFKGPRTQTNPFPKATATRPRPCDDYEMFDLHRNEITHTVTYNHLRAIVLQKAILPTSKQMN